MTTLTTFKSFYKDDAATDMYITGPAGSGKTTDLAALVQYCMDREIAYVVTAFTHKACGVLRSKLPKGAQVTTLHSFLKKRPMINTDAKRTKDATQNVVSASAEEVEVLIVDEYSMIGERDLMDVRANQVLDEDTNRELLRVLWIGDSNQLPPVGDTQAIRPSGKYNVHLTKVYRNKAPLLEPLSQLIDFIGGQPAEPLITNKCFIRGKDIIEEYQADPCTDKVVLAYTNERVESLNATLEGKTAPNELDTLTSPTTRLKYTYLAERQQVFEIQTPFKGLLQLNSKYKTLEHLLKMDGIQFASVEDEREDSYAVAYVFGHYQYKCKKEAYIKAAVDLNNEIEKKFKTSAALWSKQNPDAPLAKKRAKAWRDYLTFNECVICLDFNHAMTVHKSQGDTYTNVYLDTEDISRCADLNYKLYLKLLYVGISRSSNFVITN